MYSSASRDIDTDITIDNFTERKMGDSCFICAEPASSRCTVALDHSECLGAKVLCDDCVTELDQEGWIELNEEAADSRDRSDSGEEPDTMPV